MYAFQNDDRVCDQLVKLSYRKKDKGAMMKTSSNQPDTFPAVIVGGPPHSGKSVLVYSLTRALRERRAPHYVLRACPDGEGDWANEADRALVQELRAKGSFTQSFVRAVGGQLQARHIPLLVDVGGKPKPWQEAVFAHCTHAILLIGERADDPLAFDRDLAEWQTIMERQGVPVVAILRSDLHGRSELQQATPILKGTIAGLNRGETVADELIAALADRLQTLFTLDEALVTELHLEQAPCANTIVLPDILQQLKATNDVWLPEMLADMVTRVMPHTETAVYGRAPNWAYSAMAYHALPSAIWLFDVRLGWVQPPHLPLLLPQTPLAAVQTGWQVALHSHDDIDVLNMGTDAQILSWENSEGLPLYQPMTNRGLVLMGKIPNWLFMAATRQLAPHTTWTAVYQPQLKGAVVVATNDMAIPIGTIISQENFL